MNGSGENALFSKKLHSDWEFSGKKFGYSKLFLKLSFTLQNKGKMLWCSYFKSFIELTIFYGNVIFVKIFYFISTPWKIIIPWGNSFAETILIIGMHVGGQCFFVYTKMSFFDNFVKNKLQQQVFLEKFLCHFFPTLQ